MCIYIYIYKVYIQYIYIYIYIYRANPPATQGEISWALPRADFDYYYYYYYYYSSGGSSSSSSSSSSLKHGGLDSHPAKEICRLFRPRVLSPEALIDYSPPRS